MVAEKRARSRPILRTASTTSGDGTSAAASSTAARQQEQKNPQQDATMAPLQGSSSKPQGTTNHPRLPGKRAH